MMGYNWSGGNVAGYSQAGGFLFFAFWVLVLVLLVAIIRLVWKKGNK